MKGCLSVAPVPEDDSVLECGIWDQVRVGLETSRVRYDFLEEVLRFCWVTEELEANSFQESHKAQIIQVVFTTLSSDNYQLNWC